MAAFTSIQKTALVSAHRPGAQGIECTAQPIVRKMSVRMSIGPEIRIKRPLGPEAHPAKTAIVSNRSHKLTMDSLSRTLAYAPKNLISFAYSTVSFPKVDENGRREYPMSDFCKISSSAVGLRPISFFGTRFVAAATSGPAGSII